MSEHQFKVNDEAWLEHDGWRPDEEGGLPAGMCRVRIAAIGKNGEAFCEYISGARFAGHQFMIPAEMQRGMLHPAEPDGAAVMLPMSPAARFDYVTWLIHKEIVTRDQGIELLSLKDCACLRTGILALSGKHYDSCEYARPAAEEAPPLMVRSCEKCIASTGELLAAFRVQLDTERQRANRLGDEAGSAEARFLEMAKYRNEWEARCSDLESKARSDARTIARLKAEIATLRRFPL